MEKMSILIENLEFLESHNKNYTKKQYYTILECLEIAKELEQKPIYEKKINVVERMQSVKNCK